MTCLLAKRLKIFAESNCLLPNYTLIQRYGIRLTTGFISRCYAMLLTEFLTSFPLKVGEKWERDLGPFIEDQWEEALQAVTQCSRNVTQRLMQLYLLLRVYFTPTRIFAICNLDSPLRGKCSRDHGDLIHLT